jgi:hypothetical protein
LLWVHFLFWKNSIPLVKLLFLSRALERLLLFSYLCLIRLQFPSVFMLH